MAYSFPNTFIRSLWITVDKTLDPFWIGVDNTIFYKHSLQRGWTFKDEYNPSDAYLFAINANLFNDKECSEGMKRCIQRSYQQRVNDWHRQG